MADQSRLFRLYLIRTGGILLVLLKGTELAFLHMADHVWIVPGIFAAIALGALLWTAFDKFNHDRFEPDISVVATISSYLSGFLLVCFGVLTALSATSFMDALEVLAFSLLGLGSILYGRALQDVISVR